MPKKGSDQKLTMLRTCSGQREGELHTVWFMEGEHYTVDADLAENLIASGDAVPFGTQIEPEEPESQPTE